MLQSDPTLPLNQTTVDTLAQNAAALTAQRRLTGEDLTGLPDRQQNPLMVFSLASGEDSETLPVDSINFMAGIYYVYDGEGSVYTVDTAAVEALLKTPAALYQPQELTDHTAEEVTALSLIHI